MNCTILTVVYGAVNKNIVKLFQACHFMVLLPPVFIWLTAPVNPPESIIENLCSCQIECFLFIFLFYQVQDSSLTVERNFPHLQLPLKTLIPFRPISTSFLSYSITTLLCYIHKACFIYKLIVFY